MKWSEIYLSDWPQWLASEMSEIGEKSFNSLLIPGEETSAAEENTPFKLFFTIYTSERLSKRDSKIQRVNLDFGVQLVYKLAFCGFFNWDSLNFRAEDDDDRESSFNGVWYSFILAGQIWYFLCSSFFFF